ncbi:acyl carrier protein [Nocardioides phosphati]|uniref:Acyl carrier protein n=1 Tax=Nocardioides phosphati TaxID=1867775 RepID=A0ABQ2N940_9ACTN|nr:acyl carrier protein [Nocardioides phosphati]GGO86559.1 acyl carrier protein [Nocardioides phosphati]
MTSAPHDDVHADIAELLAQIIEVPATDITPESRLVEDLGVDSLSLLELVIGIEERFGVVIPDSEVIGLVRVEDATTYVLRAAV